MKVVIAAAGTGGHINPGIAIANKIKQENKNAKITFIGTLRGLENDLVPRAGYDLERIEAYGISRKISVQNIKNMNNLPYRVNNIKAQQTKHGRLTREIYIQ